MLGRRLRHRPSINLASGHVYGWLCWQPDSSGRRRHKLQWLDPKKTVTTANYRYNLYLLKFLGMIYVGYNSYQELRPCRKY